MSFYFTLAHRGNLLWVIFTFKFLQFCLSNDLTESLTNFFDFPGNFCAAFCASNSADVSSFLCLCWLLLWYKMGSISDREKSNQMRVQRVRGSGAAGHVGPHPLPWLLPCWAGLHPPTQPRRVRLTIVGGPLDITLPNINDALGRANGFLKQISISIL